MSCAIKSEKTIFVDKGKGNMDIVTHRKLASVALLVLWSTLGADAQCTLGAICHSGISSEDCTLPGQFWTPTQNVQGCCPGCISGNSEGATCFVGVIECGPGLVCVDRRCVLVDTEETRSCASGPYANPRYPPECDRNGDWAPVQCKGDRLTGRCFCSSANGTRIFGSNWRQYSDSMTCACSRRRSDLEAAGRTDVTLHCTADGNYETLQCDGDMCWCTAPAGQPTSHVVPEEWFRLLPCYDTAAVGMQYLRRCETIVVAHALIRREQLEHGTDFHGSPNVRCDFDGSYGSYQTSNGIHFCTNAVNSNLAPFQSQVIQGTVINCNCARDRLVYYPAAGLVHTADCESNGDYNPLQQVGNEFYCVDSDGFRSSEFFDDLDDVVCADS